jgi:lysophospholipid acyltransferase (LPLAT)-like uncharacterized protein
MLGAWAPALGRQLARSWRVEVVGRDHGRELCAAACPYVLLCWHDVLLPVMWHHRRRGISAVVSEARDGQYLATFADSLGYGLIRGSSTRGGGRALRAAIRVLADGTPIGITPDGPRGPRRILKPGVVAAAAAAGALLLPVHAEGRPGWRAASWDRFLVPAPFARVRLAYGEPFQAGDGVTAAAVERTLRELDEAARKVAWPDAGAATPTA